MRSWLGRRQLREQKQTPSGGDKQTSKNNCRSSIRRWSGDDMQEKQKWVGDILVG